jgi:hypothetical protein
MGAAKCGEKEKVPEEECEAKIDRSTRSFATRRRDERALEGLWSFVAAAVDMGVWESYDVWRTRRQRKRKKETLLLWE